MLRRWFLASMAFAQSRTDMVLVIAEGYRGTVPLDGLHFTRCYSAYPDHRQSRDAILTGRYPHAIDSNTPRLRCRLVEMKRDEVDRRLPGIAAGLPMNTILVFTSDHGGSPGTHRAARVPLAIRWPGKIAPGESDLLVSHVDLAPTLLALTGQPVPDGTHGRDLSRLLLGRNAEKPESVYVQGSNWRMVVRGLDKLVVDENGAVTHLYNLGADPDELTNLAEEPSQRLWRDELKALAESWRRRTGDGYDPSGLKKRP